MKLKGKVVLITGGSEGIGAACAGAFAKRGARLALAARNEENLRRAGGPDALLLAGDLTDESARLRAVEQTLARYGTIDVLINNAGVGLYAPTADAAMQQARAVFELNFFVPLAMTQLAIPYMRRQGSGTIVNVASIAGQVALPWLTLYSASKFALKGLTDGLRVELRRDGIHTMTVCPGYVNTGFQSHVLQGEPPPALQSGRPLSVTAEQCAEAIAQGVERNARTVTTPGRGRFLVAAAQFLPGVVDRTLERMYLRTR